MLDLTPQYDLFVDDCYIEFDCICGMRIVMSSSPYEHLPQTHQCSQCMRSWTLALMLDGEQTR